MALGQRLELRQSQQIVMTPQLQQAIKLLQMSNLEISEFVEKELERNPLLEIADADSARAAQGGHAASGGGDRGGDVAIPIQMTGIGAGDGVRGGRGGRGFDPLDSRIEDTLAGAVSLLEHLDRQIATVRAAPVVLAVARAIAADLDESGYFRSGLDEVAARLGVDVATVRKGLAVVQSCDPTGVGARDLKECLALQLSERNRYDPAMRALIENLELMARADYVKLRQLCAVDEADFMEMVAEVKALDPRPAHAFTGGASVAVVPDVYVRRGNVGSWIVELNTATLPRVLVNNAYAAEISRSGDKATRSFVSECQQDAGWLVRSLAQRARTILKVSEEIVRQQDGFFARGVAGLKPMTLKDVAGAVSMHESTVSRVTAGKFIATERGTFELKYFFTAAIGATDGGEAFSSEVVRRKISGMIDAESPQKPLSDAKIANLLEKAGVDIARRTVAKYRESMNIPSSSQRKRMNAVSL